MNIWLAVVLSIVLGFIVAFGLGFAVIPWLHKLNFGQTILDIGPSWHKKKQGTPTMGGILFIAGLAVSLAAVLITDHLRGGSVLLWGTDKPRDVIYVKVFGGLLMLGWLIFSYLAQDVIQNETAARDLLDARLLATIGHEKTRRKHRSILVSDPTVSFAFTEAMQKLCTLLAYRCGTCNSCVI